jgi:hypothetical protein
METRKNKRSAGPVSEQPDSPKNGLLPDNINVGVAQEGSDSDPSTKVQKVEQNADEIDFEALRLPPSGQVMVKKDLSTIPIRRPKKTEWFRVRPGAEWRIDLPLYEDDDKETYIVGPVCQGFLNDRKLIKRSRVYTLIVHGTGVLLLSPIGLPEADGKYNPYNRSREEAYLKAENEWVQISSNQPLGAYDRWTPETQLPDPEWPAPPNTLKEALAIAFKGRYINELDHPIIKRLGGRL